MTIKDIKTGKYIKKLPIWDTSNWESGWLDNKGRFRVYRPDYPRAYQGGYALRSHVIWWLTYGECHPKGTNLHHKNRIKNDDRIENLEVIEHRLHSQLHNLGTGIKLICKVCSNEFYVPKWRITQRKKEGTNINYCSQKCYHIARKGDEVHNKNISNGLFLAYQQGHGPAQMIKKRKI